jgi:hypothetical protein
MTPARGGDADVGGTTSCCRTSRRSGRRPDHDLALLALQEFYKPYLQRVRAEAILPWGHRNRVSAGELGLVGRPIRAAAATALASRQRQQTRRSGANERAADVAR